MIDDWTGLGSKAHLCQACGAVNETPETCIVHPLGRLEPKWENGNLSFNERMMSKVYVPTEFEGKREFE